MTSEQPETIPAELRALVRVAMEVLGKQFAAHYGAPAHAELMRVRERMVKLRSASHARMVEALDALHEQFEKLDPAERLVLAHGYSLMMEITNACENAYRTYRLKQRPPSSVKPGGRVTWVITAHPTESRAKELLPLLQRLQDELILHLERSGAGREEQIASLLAVITRCPLAPQHTPQPSDEADYLFGVSLHHRNLSALTEKREYAESFRLKSWVGGDKDGHPGVDEKTLLYSLNRSRGLLLAAVRHWLERWREVAAVHPSYRVAEVDLLLSGLGALGKIGAGDVDRVQNFRAAIDAHFRNLEDHVAHVPYSRRLENLFVMFPALVLPLELRESSDVLEELEASKTPRRFNLHRMFETLVKIGGKSVRSYADCLIISMTRDEHDLARAHRLLKKMKLADALEVVPLFETLPALQASDRIMTAFLGENPGYVRHRIDARGARAQIMLGYSDSAKESGVAPSRFNITMAFDRLERALRKFGLKPLFFHGTGGSVARGGGSLDEQTSTWSRDMVRHFKATYQGEVVSKTFAHPTILTSQIDHVWKLQDKARPRVESRPQEWAGFADLVRTAYQKLVEDPEFLDIVKTATLYPYLHELRLGSRPAKRKALSGVKDLRAIPWVLCWTQARLLLPTWWGVGTAWRDLDEPGREGLRGLYREGEGSFATLIKQVRFTMAKVELGVFEHMVSRLSPAHRPHLARFRDEYQAAVTAVRDITGERDLMAHRPLLAESLRLRSPLIHPLNVLQVIAIQRQEADLLRVTTTGIASGMLTTG